MAEWTLPGSLEEMASVVAEHGQFFCVLGGNVLRCCWVHSVALLEIVRVTKSVGHRVLPFFSDDALMCVPEGHAVDQLGV